ncbi:MAG TPA: redoxin domain-containing protein [Kofleriaceae bacterium]|nr:redoxin domain-containing protein [Kofleriaceae bacterium]
MGRLDDIVARNEKARRQRPGAAGLAGAVIDDIFDERQPPADRRRKIMALVAAVAVIAAIAIIFVLRMRKADEAPGGEVKSATGTVELSTLWSKRRVVIEFYPNKQLDYARERMAELEAARGSIDADIVGVIGLSGTVANEVAQQAKIGYPLYGDYAFTVIPEWGLKFAAADATGAATFVVETDGKISYRRIGTFAPVTELPHR